MRYLALMYGDPAHTRGMSGRMRASHRLPDGSRSGRPSSERTPTPRGCSRIPIIATLSATSPRGRPQQCAIEG